MRRASSCVFFVALLAGCCSNAFAQLYAKNKVVIESTQVLQECETWAGSDVINDYSQTIGEVPISSGSVDIKCTPTDPVPPLNGGYHCTGGSSGSNIWDADCSAVYNKVYGARYRLDAQHILNFPLGYDGTLSGNEYEDFLGFSNYNTRVDTCAPQSSTCDSWEPPPPLTQRYYPSTTGWVVFSTTTWDTTILISPQQVSLQQSQSQSFTTNWAVGSVTWQIASGPGTITSNGVYTAPSSITSAQTATIRACVTTNSGNCDTATVNLKQPVPTITTVSVDGVVNGSLKAGSTQTVKLTGSNFGTSDQIVALSGAQYLTISNVGQPQNQQTISFTVTTSGNARQGTATFQLTRSSDGSQGTSPSINIQPFYPPVPKIMMVTSTTQDCSTGTQVDNLTTQVFAGQPVILCSPTPVLPAGLTVSSSTWNPGNVLDLSGGFSANSGSGEELANPSMTTAVIGPFYWVVPDNLETMTYNYCVDNGTPCPTSYAATFDASGPTGNLLPTAHVTTDATGTAITNPQNGSAFLQMTNAPQPNPGAGIWFQENANISRGNFIWIQKLDSVIYNVLAVTGNNNPFLNANDQLDGIYPYPGQGANGLLASDGPGVPLYSFFGEASKWFDATLYVLWDPAIPPTGQPNCATAWVDTSTTPYTAHASTCASIPVPLASVTWGWSACAINTGAGASPSWTLNCGQAYADPPTASDYPQWNSCYVSQFGGCN